MADDAFDPGPDGTYPYWPRLPDGSPDPARMPTGLRRIRRSGEVLIVDVTPRDPDGVPINPPTIPPA